MDKETKDNLWKELKLLQPIIDKFDDFTFRIKYWFITIFIAVTGYSIVAEKQDLLMLNIFSIIIFYFYEVTYRIVHKAFLKRNREIQTFLREERDISNEDKAPHLDRYFREIPESSKSLIFLTKLGMEETRAKRNIHETKEIFNESLIMLTQLRISTVYLSALIVNVVIAFWFNKHLVLFISLLILLSIIIVMSMKAKIREEIDRLRWYFKIPVSIGYAVIPSILTTIVINNFFYLDISYEFLHVWFVLWILMIYLYIV